MYILQYFSSFGSSQIRLCYQNNDTYIEYTFKIRIKRTLLTYSRNRSNANTIDKRITVPFFRNVYRDSSGMVLSSKILYCSLRVTLCAVSSLLIYTNNTVYTHAFYRVSHLRVIRLSQKKIVNPLLRISIEKKQYHIAMWMRHRARATKDDTQSGYNDNFQCISKPTTFSSKS